MIMQPHGMEIFFTFKFGSVGLPEADSAVVPEIRLIGKFNKIL
jgi:hypothetical protein